IVQRMFPASPVSYDQPGKTLIVQGINSAQLELIKALIEKLDPVEAGPNDPDVRFYKLSGEAPPYLLSSLRTLVPEATIIPDNTTKQLLVVARPAEHELIRKNVDLIVSTFTPDDPVLFIYDVTSDQRKRLEAFVKTAAAELKSLQVVADDTPGKISIWAKPSEHQLIGDALMLMKAGKNDDQELQLQAFSLTSVDIKTVQDTLKTAVPEAKLIYDEQGMRIVVWASKTDMQKVSTTLLQLDPNSMKNLKLFPYPIALGDPKVILESIKQVYPNIKSQVDERNKRILIWATPEEHAAIAEMIDKINTDADVSLQEKYVSYPIPKLAQATALKMMQAFFPEMEAQCDETSKKLIVRATLKEHERIKMLLEQMQSSDDKYHPEFAIYPYGETDPVTLEGLLQGMFPEAESLTAYEIKNLLKDDPLRNLRQLSPYMYSYELYNMMRQQGFQQQQRVQANLTGTRLGCYKVDPTTRSVMVYLPEEDQKRVSTAIESIVTASQETGKQSLKTYQFEYGYIFYYLPILQEIAPTAKINSGMGRRDIIVYASEADQAKIKQFVDQVNADKDGSDRSKVFTFTIPDGTPISRQWFIRRVYSEFAGYPSEGPMPNQFFYFGPKDDVEKIQKLIDEFAKELDGAVSAKAVVYTLKYISVANAKQWLKLVAPNAQYDSESQQNRYGYGYGSSYYYDGFTLQYLRQPQPQENTEDPKARSLVIRATPKDHQKIAETLEEIDVDLPEDVKPVPQEYSFVDYPPDTLYPCFRSLRMAFPDPVASFTPQSDREVIVAVASPQTQKEIEAFIRKYIEQKEDEMPVVEVYNLEKTTIYRAQFVISQALAAKHVQLFPGVAPNQLIVYAKPADQKRVVEILGKMETLTTPENTPVLKVYHVSPQAAVLTANVLQSQIPGGFASPNAANGTVIVFGTSEQHELAERLTKSISESFPEPVTKTYFAKHLSVGRLYTILAAQYNGRAEFRFREDNGDLVVIAPEALHEEIAKSIEGIDVPQPPESEKIVVGYDISDLRYTYLWNWAAQGIAYVAPGAQIFPATQLPGHIIVFARPADQLKIKKVIDEMLKNHAETMPSVERYSIK
ncbi:MAG: hypothetical protein FWC50_14200, partial [Planctomycetaceae bacterium]|nr:hypothetical protein [Planctomycetaceae bacterium]